MMLPSHGKTLIAVLFVVCVSLALGWIEIDAALAQNTPLSDQDGQSWYDSLRTQPTLITRPPIKSTT
jgi:hypothetical protein